MQQTFNDGGNAGDIRAVINNNANDVEAYKLTEQAALDAHTSNVSNPHVVTKAQVGLGNNDNTSDLNKPISTATQAALNNKADLVGGKVPSGQLPSFVDDVEEYANLAGFPGSGETGKIYVALDTNIVYRWSGSAYVEISASLALGETSGTAYRGDRGKTAYDHSQATGNPHGAGVADIIGLTTALADKSDIARTQKAGVALAFDKDAIYGTVASPETGNITLNATGAKLGAEILVIHQTGAEPTYGAEFKKLTSSEAYDPAKLNYIYFKFITASKIIFRIDIEL